MLGFDVLERLREDPVTQAVPVVVVTSKVLAPEEESRPGRAGGGGPPEGSLLATRRRGAHPGCLDARGVDAGGRGGPAQGGAAVTVLPPLILNVDDNEGVRYATTRVLKQAGFRVEEAGNGEEALARAPAADLVVLDVKLPGMSGFEVCRRIKSDPALTGIPVLHLTSAYGGSEHWATALDAGADGFQAHLAKPIQPSHLVQIVAGLAAPLVRHD
jgi:CheY-like chemotaxis protein